MALTTWSRRVSWSAPKNRSLALRFGNEVEEPLRIGNGPSAKKAIYGRGGDVSTMVLAAMRPAMEGGSGSS